MAECTHPVQMAGMCAVCGKELDTDTLAQASFSMMHSHSGVKVSEDEARRLDSETAAHLLSQRKLALIVDLDQTIIHATVDPTVGEWMKDNNNPNWEALKDVGRFKLGIDGKAVASDPSSANGNDEPVDNQAAGCWYYVKPRPGLDSFLNSLSQRYELHVYTMGTRSYADCVCKLVDPDGSIFGNRILSRDENGSLVSKSLSRLFPVDTSMVVIIDDRADVWKWSPNLVKVQPYDFFVGIGDINATFLPAAPALPGEPIPVFPEDLAAASSSASSLASASSSDEKGSDAASTNATTFPSPSSAESGEGADGTSGDKEETSKKESQEAAALLVIQTQNLQYALTEQRQARPLAKMQEALDEKLEAEAGTANGTRSSTPQVNGKAKEGEAETAAEATSQGSSSEADKADESEKENAPIVPSASTPAGVGKNYNAHAVLRDDDTELDRIQKILDSVHGEWYAQYDQNEKSKASTTPPKPTVMEIIAGLKSKILRGCNLVFSSIIPREQPPKTSDIWRVAEEYGAACSEDLVDGVTHLIAARHGTVKVNRAHKISSVSVVYPGWLHDSVAKWAKQPESWYTMPEPSKLSDFDTSISTADGKVEAENLDSKPPSTLGEGDGDGEVKDGGDEYEGGAGDGDFAEMDWAGAADEVDAFMDDDDTEDETDNDSALEDTDGEGLSFPSTPRRRQGGRVKRDRSSTAANEDDGDGSDGEGPVKDLMLKSPLSKRRKMAEERAGQSKLKQSITSEEVPTLSSTSASSVVAEIKAPSAAKGVATGAATPADDTGTETGSIDESFLDDLANEMELQMEEADDDDDDDDDNSEP